MLEFNAMVSCGITVMLMLVLRPVATIVGLIDAPGGRKRHGAPVPVIGGLAMIVGLGYGVFMVERPDWFGTSLIGILAVVLAGVVDDLYDIRASLRLLVQSCAALFVVLASNLVITDVGLPWSLGVLTVPFTVVFILTVVNAFNFIDGVDGLAGGLALVATSTIAAASGDTSLFEVMRIVTSVLVGYLLFNLPLGFNGRLRAFMGDTGSTLLGFTIAIALIDVTQPAGDRPGMSPVVGGWLVAVPVFDLFAVVGRRLLTGRSPFAADREHLHHKLVDAGLSMREALVVLLVLAVGFTCVGVAGSASKVSNAALIGLWFMACFSYYQLSCHAAAVVRLVRTVRLRTLGRWLGSSPSDESFPIQAASRE